MTTNGTHPANMLTAAMQVPFSQEAEEAVIGAVLVNPAEAFPTVAQFLKATDFYFIRNAWLWAALEALYRRDKDSIDYLTLSSELQARGQLNDVGGQAYLTHLAFNVPTSQHAEVYGRLVQRAATRRRMMIAADEIRKLAADEQIEVDTVVSKAYTKLADVTSHVAVSRMQDMNGGLSECTPVCS